MWQILKEGSLEEVTFNWDSVESNNGLAEVGQGEGKVNPKWNWARDTAYTDDLEAKVLGFQD